MQNFLSTTIPIFIHILLSPILFASIPRLARHKFLLFLNLWWTYSSLSFYHCTCVYSYSYWLLSLLFPQWFESQLILNSFINFNSSSISLLNLSFVNYHLVHFILYYQSKLHFVCHLQLYCYSLSDFWKLTSFSYYFIIHYWQSLFIYFDEFYISVMSFWNFWSFEVHTVHIIVIYYPTLICHYLILDFLLLLLGFTLLKFEHRCFNIGCYLIIAWFCWHFVINLIMWLSLLIFIVLLPSPCFSLCLTQTWTHVVIIFESS